MCLMEIFLWKTFADTGIWASDHKAITVGQFQVASTLGAAIAIVLVVGKHTRSLHKYILCQAKYLLQFSLTI